MPLVIDLHGSGSSPDGQAGLSQFEALAGDEGFLVATPAGMYPRPDAEIVSWNVYLDEGGVDDVLFIRKLIAQTSEQFSVDPTRIFTTGMSGGARMSSRLGCDLSDLIAAIAPVAGASAFFGASAPRFAVSLTAFVAVLAPSSPAGFLAVQAVNPNDTMAITPKTCFVFSI